jgi:hypothetical protein
MLEIETFGDEFRGNKLQEMFYNPATTVVFGL